MASFASGFVAPNVTTIQQAGIWCPSNSMPLLTVLPPRAWLCIRGGSQSQSYFDKVLMEFGFWLDCERMLHIAVALGVLDLSYSWPGMFPQVTPRRRLGPRSSPLLLDVGAHVGTCSIRFASFGVPVIAVEPHPVSAERLRSSLRLNGLESKNVSVIEAAVQQAGGFPRAALHSSPEDEDVAYTGNLQFNVTERGNLLVKDVPATSLAEILEKHPLLQRASPAIPYRGLHSHRALGIVKIDVEGAEFEVLRSSVKSNICFLADLASVLFVDIHPQSLIARGERVIELYAWLSVQGFWIIEIEGTSNLFVAVHERIWPASYEELFQLVLQATRPTNNLKSYMSFHVAQKVALENKKIEDELLQAEEHMS